MRIDDLTNEPRLKSFDPVEEFRDALATTEVQLDIFAQGVRKGDLLRGGLVDRYEVTEVQEMVGSGRIRIQARDNPVSDNLITLRLKPATVVAIYRVARSEPGLPSRRRLMELKDKVSVHASANSSADELAPIADLLLLLCENVEELNRRLNTHEHL